MALKVRLAIPSPQYGWKSKIPQKTNIVDGRNPAKPVEVGSLSHDLQGFSTMQPVVGQPGFLVAINSMTSWSLGLSRSLPRRRARWSIFASTVCTLHSCQPIFNGKHRKNPLSRRLKKTIGSRVFGDPRKVLVVLMYVFPDFGEKKPEASKISCLSQSSKNLRFPVVISQSPRSWSLRFNGASADPHVSKLQNPYFEIPNHSQIPHQPPSLSSTYAIWKVGRVFVSVFGCLSTLHT